MIITKLKPYKKIKSKLKKTYRIGIVSCNACARVCGTGGVKEMKILASRLKKEGYNIVDQDLIGAPCIIGQLKKDKLHGDTTLVLACDSGVYNLKKLFPRKRIIAALETIGLAAINKIGKPIVVRRLVRGKK
ncbi:MAG: hypothetical protein ISS82_04890 [Nanoarchaeota archaeon]|nr:hypothetical protein [Nanoarchaeota archaeon]